MILLSTKKSLLTRLLSNVLSSLLSKVLIATCYQAKPSLAKPNQVYLLSVRKRTLVHAVRILRISTLATSSNSGMHSRHADGQRKKLRSQRGNVFSRIPLRRVVRDRNQAAVTTLNGEKGILPVVHIKFFQPKLLRPLPDCQNIYEQLAIM